MCGIYARFTREEEEKSNDDDDGAQSIQHRGPDHSQTLRTTTNGMSSVLTFHRLSIMDPSEAGHQPFVGQRWTLVCNGEIYNAEALRKQHLSHVTMQGHSDCEVIWQLLEHNVFSFSDMVKQLYGVYAIVAIEHKPDGCSTVHLARDRVGVRPLYWVMQPGTLVVASEPCALAAWGSRVKPFPPDTAGYVTFGDEGEDKNNAIFTVTKAPTLCYSVPDGSGDAKHRPFTLHTREEAVAAVRTVLEQTVRVRMMSDRPMACMLSGGVDSSTVAALVAKFSNQPIHTFSIGLEGSTDLHYARIMARHIHSIHHEVILTEDDFLQAVPEVIRAIQSYDVTTVRASTPMYLLAKYIRQHTEFKVIFSGEGPDEVCGSYMYFHAAPDAASSDAECRRLVKDMHYFDVLRADRCTAHWGLEVRVPLLGVDFIQTYWSIDPELRIPYKSMEKWILRKAAEDWLPSEICWRPKEAFSDGVSTRQRSWFHILQDYIDPLVSDELLRTADIQYPHHTPQTKEGLWIRQHYEQMYPHMEHLIPYQWLPRWVGNVKDPSARILSQYHSK